NLARMSPNSILVLVLLAIAFVASPHSQKGFVRLSGSLRIFVPVVLAASVAAFASNLAPGVGSCF
ncbi:MAG: hypothetical protein ACI89D_002555, partial [Bermanella sp.]